jgi:hypothetical protein
VNAVGSLLSWWLSYSIPVHMCGNVTRALFFRGNLRLAHMTDLLSFPATVCGVFPLRRRRRSPSGCPTLLHGRELVSQLTATCGPPVLQVDSRNC